MDYCCKELINFIWGDMSDYFWHFCLDIIMFHNFGFNILYTAIERKRANNSTVIQFKGPIFPLISLNAVVKTVMEEDTSLL